MAALAINVGLCFESSAQDMRAVARVVRDEAGTYSGSTLPKMCVNAHVKTATAAKTVTLLETLRAGCVRIDWNWDIIERDRPGTYNWDGKTLTDPSGAVSFSSYFSTICGSGIQPILLAAYNNPLYAAGAFTAVSGPTNVEGYSNFGKALARQAKALKCPGPIIEAFNEPNLKIWTSGARWSGSDYAPVLRTFSAAVKTIGADVTVFSGGVSPGPGIMPVPWIMQLMSANTAFPDVDGLALHPYSYSQAADKIASPFPDQLLLDLKAFRAGSAGSKPIAITEYGFPYTAVGNNLDMQGIYTGWAMLASIVAKVSYFASYDLVDDGLDYGATGENTFGLFFNGASSAGHPVSDATSYGIKPAGTAFRSVTKTMASTKSYRISYDSAASAVVIAFEKSEGTTFAIWTTKRTRPQAYSAPIGQFGSVSCKDLLGKQLDCNYSGKNLSITLSVAVGPVLVTALR